MHKRQRQERGASAKDLGEKRHKTAGAQVLSAADARVKCILASLLHNDVLATVDVGSSASGLQQPSSETGLEALKLPDCSCCPFHRAHALNIVVNSADVRQRVSPFSWPHVKQLLHRRAIHSLTIQHSADGQRALLRSFIHLPPPPPPPTSSSNPHQHHHHPHPQQHAGDGAPEQQTRLEKEKEKDKAAAARAAQTPEICSCFGGTPNAAYIAAAAIAARGPSSPPSNGNATPTPTTPAQHFFASTTPAGTCDPPERYTHVVQVLLRTSDWSLLACSSSCCGVGYDALHSQLCPGVAAVMLA
ncbi:hypothetical protein Agub_g11109, partial [Astrephomene gubernaculifera]